jgi:hypothetical protein
MDKLIQWLYLIGQIIEIVGAFFLFKYSSPPNAPRLPGAFIFANGPTPEDFKNAKKYPQYFKIGFILLIIGFALQFPTSIINVLK